MQYGPAGSALRKQAETGVRPRGGSRAQLIIGGVAIVVIAVVVIVGILLNRSNTETKNEGYGSSKASVAALNNGVVTLGTGAAGAKAVDVYEDPLCPICGAFEQQYGQQIAQSVDEGKLTVNYHFLNFLDKGSASKDYSTRAAAALYCTAQDLGSVKGVWASLHTTLYAKDVQPAENASSDLSNDQLNERITAAATGLGVAADSPQLAAAKTCVTSGEMLPTVKTSYDASAATLTSVIQRVATPAVIYNGAAVGIDNGAWLTNLLAG